MDFIFLFIVSNFAFHFYVFAQSPKTDSTAKKTTLKQVLLPQQLEHITFYKDNEIEAKFPGGTIAWSNFLNKHLKTNIAEKNKAPKGKYTVFVNFTINKKGKPYNIYCETKNGFGMEEEVIRVIKISPDWKAATFDNKPINAKRRQPIIFVVE